MATSLKQDIDRLRRLRVAKDKDSAKAKKSEREFKVMQQRVKDRMDAEGVQSMKVNGVMFSPAETTYAQIQDRGEFVKWCLETGNEELIGYKENGDLLNTEVRRRLDDGETLPPGVGLRVREYISQTAS